VNVKLLPHREYLDSLKGEKAVLIAGFISHFPDDVIRLCMGCGNEVFIRPYNNEATKIICVDCFLKMVKT
jgi:hypothetical protein